MYYTLLINYRLLVALLQKYLFPPLKCLLKGRERFFTFLATFDLDPRLSIYILIILLDLLPYMSDCVII